MDPGRRTTGTDANGVSDRAEFKRRPGWTLPAPLAPYGRTLGTTAGLVAATVLNSGTGFVFWWIAARQFPAAAVGLAGAAVSAMLLLSQIAMLGLGTQLVGVLHRESRATSLAITALIAAGTAASLLALAFGLLAPAFFPELAGLADSPLTLALFVAGVSLTTLGSMLDQVLVALFRNVYQLLRNAVFSFGRLVLLVAAAALFGSAGSVIFGAWVVGVLVSLITILVLAHASRLTHDVRPLMFRPLAAMTRGALSHHVLNLSRSSSVWLLPLIVTVMLSHAQNASFYVALVLANFVTIVSTSATFTLYVVGARAPHELWRHLRLTLGIAAGVSMLGALVLTVAGRQLLGAFGPSYAEAYPTVAILGISCLPMAVKDHWIAIQRVRGAVTSAAVIGVGFLVLELVAAGIGAANGGLIGLAAARLTVLVAQAAVLAPIVYRWLFPGGTGPAVGASADGRPGPVVDG